jgi:hypothetical protein
VDAAVGDVAVRSLLAILALLAMTGCTTLWSDAKKDIYPAGYEAQCQRANDEARARVTRIAGHELRRTRGWHVRLVEGADSPYGKAIRCDASPTGWAGAVTEGNNTVVVRSRMDAGTLVHEGQHYWGKMNNVEVGL